MEYNGCKHPVCHSLLEPPLYSRENREAIGAWNLLASDRSTGMGPSTLRTESILSLCKASGLTWEIFLKIKTVESIYFSGSLKRHSSKVEKIKKGKDQNAISS